LPKTRQTKEERDNSERHVHPTAKARTKHAAEEGTAVKASEEKRLGLEEEEMAAEKLEGEDFAALELKNEEIAAEKRAKF